MTRVLIVEARFYEDIANEMAAGAAAHLAEQNIAHDRIWVPGVFEVPAAIRFASQRTDGPAYDGYVAIGCVIRGETTHYDYVCNESARALQDLASRDGLAIGYGIVTVENADQAWERANRNRKNKGGATAQACLRMMALRTAYGVV